MGCQVSWREFISTEIWKVPEAFSGPPICGTLCLDDLVSVGTSSLRRVLLIRCQSGSLVFNCSGLMLLTKVAFYSFALLDILTALI